MRLYPTWGSYQAAARFEEVFLGIRTTVNIFFLIWVTDLEITPENIKEPVRGGRCRWKIENECLNTLKNQGYHLEHNYGHGEANLCFNFFLLTLLVFYFHHISEMTCYLYQACREKFGSKRHLWETLRNYIKIIVFQTWEHLLDFALTPRKYQVSCQSP